MKREKMILAAVAAMFVLGIALLVASSALAQTPLVEGSSPKFVADSPSAGWVPCWNTALTDTMRGVMLLSVSADTETKFTAWRWRSAKLPHKVKWPLYGPAASDTTYIVHAGQTLTFRWPAPGAQYLYIKSGNADFSGE